MPIVRLSGSVTGKDDPNRKVRAKLLYHLFDGGWDIYNGNGDQSITLSNIQEKIKEADAFVFTPGAMLDDMFHAASIFVGYQTGDDDLRDKPMIILNADHSWNPFLQLLDHLHFLGTVSQPHHSFIEVVDKPKEVLSGLEDFRPRFAEITEEEWKRSEEEYKFPGGHRDKKPDYNVCVFCSASSKKPEHLEGGLKIGHDIAEEKWGCISGAGKTGIMGQVVRGAYENNGWTAGSNVPRIVAMEGLPAGLSEFWPRDNIYTRMEVMIEESDAFIILPGGAGTVQELFALILLKKQNHALMKDKPIVIVNCQEEGEKRFWDPMIKLAMKHYGVPAFTVVNKVEEAVPMLKSLQKPAKKVRKKKPA